MFCQDRFAESVGGALQELLRIGEAALVLVHRVVLGEELGPVRQEGLLPERHRVGVDAALFGDLPAGLLPAQGFQYNLEHDLAEYRFLAMTDASC